MDKQTANYYSTHADAIFERYESVESNITDFYQTSFSANSSLLDIGAGSGRDLRKMLELGYDAYGMEPCDELRQAAIKKHPELSARLSSGSLPNLTTTALYDGIVCSAVFMHLPEHDHLDALINIRNCLKPNGRFLISIPIARPNLNKENRDSDGRLFQPISSDKIKLLCARLGLECITEHNNEDALGRAEHVWRTLLFQKKTMLGRPLDRIESVLRNDRKVATYKLALIRAFCDLAEQDENGLDWSVHNQVALPVSRIAECWLMYYWPLIASKQLIPQNNSIASGGRPIAFRGVLSELISSAQQHFGVESESLLSLFYLHWKKNLLPEALIKLLQKCLRIIQTAIINGPVKYAEQGDMFAYDRQLKSVLINSELWTELCLTGYWIKDSLLLRWSELCEQFSHKHIPSVTKGVVLEHLLTSPAIEREQQLARRHYLLLTNLECVWSGKLISAKSLDVDHGLPYSLWHNNHLWNLFPTDKTINRQKSDQTPSPVLITHRKETILTYWDYLFRQETALFQFEIERTLGVYCSQTWHQKLLIHFKSRAEQAIYSRCSKSWQPENG